MDMNLTPHPDKGSVIIPKRSERMVMDLDTCIGAWLHAKHGRSESTKTARAYKDTLSDFRHLVKSTGHDLDGDPALIAPLAQGWAATSKQADRVTPNTYNQRLAILSSFYRYAIKHEVLVVNPIERIERRVVRKEQAAMALSPKAVKEGLGTINRKTAEGKRDHALLQVALATGRRVGELSAMRYGHLTWQGTTVVVRWPRCKGNKTMTDTLPVKTTAALLEYLHEIYDKDLAKLPADSPIWISFSDRNQGQAVSARTLERICERHLGTSKFHATRHTWAVTMHKKGATLSDIGRGLGHSNLKTTSDYLEEQLAHENPYAQVLEDEFGFEE